MQAARTGIALAFFAAAIAATYALPRLDLPHPRRIPVEDFPRQIGEWRAIADNETSEDVRKALPTATIVDRHYRDNRGRVINVVLVTATEMRDIHSPAVCLPGSGWKTDKDELVVQDGQKITARIMSVRKERYHVWFWYPPVPYPEPKNPLVRAMYKWRLTAPGTYRPDTIADLSSSLMVRVITPDVDGSDEAVRDFVEKSKAPLAELIARVPVSK
ncbi:MAG: EpsI family protein [Chthonomonadales bacterium]|nr:EpsI family protein [Chthonomonadales bacterium]